jgi:hypothetical protein
MLSSYQKKPRTVLESLSLLPQLVTRDGLPVRRPALQERGTSREGE